MNKKRLNFDIHTQENNKHAYLIMCHTNINQLFLLLDVLDNERNDIYLHIDKKANGYSIAEIKNHIKRSTLTIIKPMNVNWGGDSQVRLELRLLKEALKTEHKYYHLISGMDLPIKTQEYIYEFFDNNDGTNYISLELNHPHNVTKSVQFRLNYFYLFQNIVGRNNGRNNGKIPTFFSRLQEKSIQIQKVLNVNRTKNSDIVFIKGANWFSITQEAADYVINNYYMYKKYFRQTLGADEYFLQTIMYNSPLLSTIEDNNLRLIDWKRGNPYVFTIDDYSMIKNSPEIFARKFDENVDNEIIKLLYNELK